jgi:hypothetical protein
MSASPRLSFLPERLRPSLRGSAGAPSVDRCIKRAAALQSDLRLAQSFCLSDRGSYAFGGSRSKVRLPSPARAGQAYRPRPRLSKHRRRAAAYRAFRAYFFRVRIQSTRFLMSALLT